MPSPREKCHGGGTSSHRRLELGKSSCEGEGKSPPGSQTPRSPGSDGSSVSDDTCPICLGNITDRCVIRPCFHPFCLVCLKEWSKQKAVCPLCKESFSTIMYDIKSEAEYKEWKVPKPEPAERSQTMANFQQFFESGGRRFFSYRTTNLRGALNLRRQHPGLPAPSYDAIPPGPREPRSATYNLRGSSLFRLSVYLNNMWVQPIADITGRYRQSSPELYREQPALTHRLVPWVNRELAALLPSTRIGMVLTEVMDLIERHPISSREFRRAVRPHLGSRTNHFVHEFYHFARSPYDMVGHDNAAQYVPRYGFNDESRSDSSSSEDSDAVVEVDFRGNPISTASNREPQQASAVPVNVEREEVLTQEGSVLISSDDSSDSDTPQQPNLFLQHPAISQSSLSETHNPEPPVPAAAKMRQLLGRARNFLNTINEGASTSRFEGSMATQSNINTAMKREATSDSDDAESCMIVEEVNKRQQTPEVINLDSEEEEEEEKCRSSSPKNSSSLHSIQARGGPSNSNPFSGKKGRKKPCLNRTNFPLPLGQPSGSGFCKKSNKDDHSYCGERDTEPSSSSGRARVIHTSSSEASWCNYQNSKQTAASVRRKERQKSFIISSDSESSVPDTQRERTKHKDNKYKVRESSSKWKCGEQNRCEDDYESCSWQNAYSPREKCSAKRTRKDHRSKVKNSSRSLHWLSSHKKHDHGHNYVSDSSSNSPWTPPSSNRTERSSSREGQCQEGSSTSESRSSYHKGKKGDHSSSKSRYLSKKGKHKSKDRHKKDKSRKVKKTKNKHKKRRKSKKTIYTKSSSTSDTESDSSEVATKRPKRKASRIQDDVSSSWDSSPEPCFRSKTRKVTYSESSSTSE